MACGFPSLVLNWRTLSHYLWERFRMTNLSRFPQGFLGFISRSPASQETTQSEANLDSWSPWQFMENENVLCLEHGVQLTDKFLLTQNFVF